MKRRDFLRNSGTLAAVAAVAAMPAQALAFGNTVTVSNGAINNPHTGLALKWIRQRLNERVLYFREEMFQSGLKLTDPSFKIVEGKPVWSWMTGATKENGVAIFIKERGIPITSIGIATSLGYETYFHKPRDTEKYPDYFVRSPFLSYDERQLIEPHLPKGHIFFDERWLELALRDIKRGG